jgi:uncharacterized CHY-type Zn-finger protein
MEKIFCDFCKQEITLSLISTIEHRTNFIHYNEIKEVIVSADTSMQKYDLCAKCNQEFMDYIDSKVR